MKKVLLIIFLFTLVTSTATLTTELKSQSEGQRLNYLETEFSKLNRLKITGYVQAQWQLAETKGIDGFQDGGKFNNNTINRFMLRRGHLKFTYTSGIAQIVFLPNLTEKGVSIKDAYLNLSAPNKYISGRLGLFTVPFGYEINTASSVLESPERSRMFVSFFPNIRDLGAMLILDGQDVVPGLKLEAGFFSGNGIGAETDSRKDFAGRLIYEKKIKNSKLGAICSYYNGGVLNPVDTNYVFSKDNGFTTKTGDVSKTYELRQYFGIGFSFTTSSSIGNTKLTAEYLFGSQPGTKTANNNPAGTSFGNGTAPIYLRDFNGYYAMLVQDIGKTPHSIVLKYDYYDPNTKISGDDIGLLAGTGAADIAYQTIGAGYIFDLSNNIRLSAYYNIPINEKSINLQEYDKRIKQSILTLRTQVKF